MRRHKRPRGTTVSRSPGAAVSWVILALLTAGGLAVYDGLQAQRRLVPVQDKGTIPAQEPPRAAAAPAKNGDRKTVRHTYLPYSEPTAIYMPSIGVSSELISVGKAADGSMEVPQAPNFDKAAWYRHSPTPGQYGASVIIGHVDSYHNDNGASIFYSLPRLQLGDNIDVRRADGSTVRFAVRAIRDYGKHELPTEIIYGPVTELPELRLITCSGRFDPATHNYERNTVVYATAVNTSGILDTTSH